MRRLLRHLAVPAAVLSQVIAAGGQPPADTARSGAARTARALAPVVLLAGVATFDAHLQKSASARRTGTLDAVADLVDPLGRARYLVPALAGSYALTRLTGRDQLSAAIARVAAGYFAADAVGSVLKPGVGRRRPRAGGPWQFRPLRLGEDGDWHSFPSAHTVHVTALAAGVAAEARRPWVTVLAFGAAGLVGLQRVYTGAHWPSDVVAGGIIGVTVGGSTVRWLKRGERAAVADGASAFGGRRVVVQPSVGPGVVGAAVLVR